MVQTLAADNLSTENLTLFSRSIVLLASKNSSHTNARFGAEGLSLTTLKTWFRSNDSVSRFAAWRHSYLIAYFRVCCLERHVGRTSWVPQQISRDIVVWHRICPLQDLNRLCGTAWSGFLFRKARAKAQCLVWPCFFKNLWSATLVAARYEGYQLQALSFRSGLLERYPKVWCLLRPPYGVPTTVEAIVAACMQKGARCKCTILFMLRLQSTQAERMWFAAFVVTIYL